MPLCKPLEYQVRETKDIPVRSFPQPFAPGVPAQILYSVAYPPPAVNRQKVTSLILFCAALPLPTVRQRADGTDFLLFSAPETITEDPE